MGSIQDDVDLEPSPHVPGGGPASRWRPSRVTSALAWGWLGMLVLAVALGALGLTVGTRDGGMTDGALYVLVAAGLVVLVLLCGVYATAMAAFESRVDDDMLTYAVGLPVDAVPADVVPGHEHADGTVEIDRRRVGVVIGEGVHPNRLTALVIGDRRYTVLLTGLDDGLLLSDQLPTARPRYRLVAESGVVATATGFRHGHRQDWVLEADGMVLRWREHLARPVSRCTLLDDGGRAWRVCFGRRDAVAARLPEELSTVASAFCVIVLSEAHRRASAVSATVGTGHGVGIEL